MNQPNELKHFKDTHTKDEFYYKMYGRTPTRKLRKSINLIIYDFRKNLKEHQGDTFKDIVRTKTIYKKELIEYAETYGYPDGYKKETKFKNEKYENNIE